LALVGLFVRQAICVNHNDRETKKIMDYWPADA